MKKYLIIYFWINFLTLFCHQTYAKTLEHMIKDNKLTVIIHRPIHYVFEFTTNPRKTPEWINSVIVEKTNEWPPQQGTIYKNRSKFGPWYVYKVTKYTEGKEFELAKQDKSTYHVNYTYSTSPDGATKLVYHEWVTNGSIEDPFTQDNLDNLKNILENK